MLTSTLFAKSEFTTSFIYMMLKGQDVFNYKLYFLVNGHLITKTATITKAQMHSTGGKGTTARWKLNGKAISRADLDAFLMTDKNVEVLYSANVYELKSLIAKA